MYSINIEDELGRVKEFSGGSNARPRGLARTFVVRSFRPLLQPWIRLFAKPAAVAGVSTRSRRKTHDSRPNSRVSIHSLSNHGNMRFGFFDRFFRMLVVLE